MDFLEKDLEDIIYDSHCKDSKILNERGLPARGVMKRQLKIGNYGVADLVTFSLNYQDEIYHASGFKEVNPFLDITIYELKKDKIGVEAFFQAIRYAKGIERYLAKRGFYDSNDVCVSIVLIGKEIETNTSFSYISDVLPNLPNEFNSSPFLNVYTYSYDAIKGIVFNNEYGYRLTKEGFNCKKIKPL